MGDFVACSIRIKNELNKMVEILVLNDLVHFDVNLCDVVYCMRFIRDENARTPIII